jgi:hypothetical protein
MLHSVYGSRSIIFCGTEEHKVHRDVCEALYFSIQFRVVKRSHYYLKPLEKTVVFLITDIK